MEDRMLSNRIEELVNVQLPDMYILLKVVVCNY